MTCDIFGAIYRPSFVNRFGAVGLKGFVVGRSE